MSSCHCGRRFSDPSALQQHQRSKAHCYYRECDRFFVHTDAVEQHRSALHSFTWFDCDRTFVCPEALQRHQNSMGHCYCRKCDRLFVTSDALSQHLQSPIHTTQFRGCDCDREFVDEQALHQHLADKIYNPRTISKISSIKPSNRVCKECGREFKNEKGLEQHRSSVVHKPLSNLKCVGDRRCKKRFSSPSAWLHHFESGACPSSITRDKLYKAVQSSDVDHFITQGRIQEYSAFKWADMSRPISPTESVIFTPVTDDTFSSCPSSPASLGSQPGMFTPGSGSSQRLSEALSLAIRLSCPLCPFGRKPFKSLEAMKNHLSSPAHSPKLFHCPLVFPEIEKNKKKVSQLMRYFSTLSGLMQHLESGACQGGRATFRKTVEYLEQNLGKMGLRQLRLLN